MLMTGALAALMLSGCGKDSADSGSSLFETTGTSGGKTSVSLEAVSQHHPFYGLEGSNNIVLLTTERYKEYPMLIQGYGASASVTAAGVFANIMSIANI